jgi:protein-S-isoprenylcysteine O-methyltransferase Ste14
MFPLLQLVLHLFTAFLLHIGITNPNPTNNTDYVADEGIGGSLASNAAPKVGKTMVWIMTLYQVLYLFLQAFSPSLIPVLFPQLPLFVDPLPWTSTLVLGYILMIIGSLGRLWCYKTLGIFFTYEITIRQSHKLIRTGPYAYVRHPSYTFILILVTGMFLVHQRLANFLPNNQFTQILFGPLAILANWIMLILVFMKRVVREEEELKKKFGKEWTQYTSETKRFIPGLI